MFSRVKPFARGVWRRAVIRYPKLHVVRARLTGVAAAGLNAGGGADPAKMVWIFGSGRSGSTWLRSMMGEMSGHRVWEEPLVGRLFGEFYDRVQRNNLDRADFIMGDPTRRGWIRSIHNFVLDGARYAHPFLTPDDYLIIKEPNGSQGAPLLMEALPESRMILLVRDPRDAVASNLDAARKGGWLHEWADKGAWKREGTADRDPDAFVRMRADIYAQQVGSARRAYEAHGGPRSLVRYEDLLADTLGAMNRLYEELDIPFDAAELARVVEKHSWTNIPEEEKGEGMFYRKAEPGGWNEDLTPEQAALVEEATTSLLEEFYPG